MSNWIVVGCKLTENSQRPVGELSSVRHFESNAAVESNFLRNKFWKCPLPRHCQIECNYMMWMVLGLIHAWILIGWCLFSGRSSSRQSSQSDISVNGYTQQKASTLLVIPKKPQTIIRKWREYLFYYKKGKLRKIQSWMKWKLKGASFGTVETPGSIIWVRLVI